MTTDDERALIDAAQADPARFLDLYDRYVDRVYAYVSRRPRNRAVAEDVTSAVFGPALAKLPSFEWRGVPFAAWLFRIAANVRAEPADRPYGERSGFVQDPYGHRWYTATSFGPSPVPAALRTVTAGDLRGVVVNRVDG